MFNGRPNFNVVPLICAVSAFAAFGLAPTTSVAATIVVSPSNMGNWAFDHRDANGDLDANSNGIGQMVNGPATPPLGTGSAQLATGDGTNNGDGAQELRNTGYANTALANITALSYSTYDTKNNGQQFPFIALEVNWNDGGSTNDDRLFFEPPYQTHASGNGSLPDQGATALNTWQTWNALAGGWWANSGTGGCNPGTGVCAFSDYLLAHPGATLVNFPGALGGVELRVGQASPDDQFNGYVDNFTIGVSGANTTFDFEAASATPLPAAFPLFVTGLGALGLFGWRRKRKGTALAV